MRILALDVGDVRIGFAVCDELEIGAYPVSTFHRRGSLANDVAGVAQIIREQQAELILVGLPTSLNGDEGSQAKRVRVFARKLSACVPIPIEFWDESLSSVEAEQRLVALDVSRERRREVRDQWAAAILLESYMEHRRLGRKRDFKLL